MRYMGVNEYLVYTYKPLYTIISTWCIKLSAVISVRVPKELKEEAERLKIDIKKVVEESLRRAIIEKKKELLAKAIKQFVEATGNLSEEEWVEIIKNSRKRLDKK